MKDCSRNSMDALTAEAHRVAHMTARRICLVIPSVCAAGEQFPLRISVTGWDGLPCGDVTNTLVFEECQGVDGLPRTFSLAPGEAGARIDGLRAARPGVAIVRARVAGTGHKDGDPRIVSNPAWVFDTPPYRLFWGDLHVHTSFSNCSGWRCLDPEWCYRYAREVSCLDFVAPADHLRGIAADAKRWPRLQHLARQYNDPGRFVSFLAFESSHAQGCGGDNNVYYLDDDAPYFWLERDDMHGIAPAVPLQELWKQLDANGRPYFTVPHHTGRAGKFRSWDENCYSPAREPLFEIYSSWGSSEMRWSRYPMSGGNNDAPSYFTDALKAGTRFGVIASSDDHATLPGSVHQFRIEPFRVPTMQGHAHKGLAAIRAPELARAALFNAMRQRNTYATTHARSLVDLRIGDAGMGGEIAADASLRRRRTIRVQCTIADANTCRVVLMRNGEELAVQSLRGPQVASAINEVVFDDDVPLERVALKDAPFHPAPFAVYHARIEDQNGGAAWTSPVWIDL
ncbi:hypothetical protein GX586_14635 [bacterium]|nr:hypothetical protein [bacterium]